VRGSSLLLALVVLVGCCPGPDVPITPASPLQLPTRVPATATPAPTQVDARLLYEAGLACRGMGDDAGALRSFTQAIEIDPDFAPTYIARGSVYLAHGQLDAALDDAESAIAIDSDDASAHALRGEILWQLGRSREASRAFDRAVALDPDLEEQTFQSRWLAALAGHDADRLTDLGGWYGTNHPEDPLRHYYRGWAYIEQGRPDVAIYLLVGAIQGTPRPPALLWFTLGHAYMESDSWQEAVTCFEAAGALIQAGDVSLEIHTQRPVADFFAAMGQAYLRVGRCADAEAMLQHAVAVAGPRSEYLDLLEEVERCKTPAPTPTSYPTTTPPA
jgi:tetratricopeptide (TPR) repeat protein